MKTNFQKLAGLRPNMGGLNLDTFCYYIYIYIYIHTHIYIYIYIYISSVIYYGI